MKHQDFELYAEEKPFGSKMSKTWVAVFREVVCNQERELKELRVLDIGCGDDRIYLFLLEGFDAENVHGVVVSQARIDRCHYLG